MRKEIDNHVIVEVIRKSNRKEMLKSVDALLKQRKARRGK